MNFLSLLLLILVILLPGLAFWSTLSNSTKLSGLESVFMCLLAGTVTTSWLSITLAEFAIFSLPLLLALVLIPSGFIIGWAFWRGELQAAFSGVKWHWYEGIAGLLLLVGIVLSGRPSEYIIGGRDHGVYINTAVHIAKTGSIIVKDSDIMTVSPELQPTVVWPETRTYQAGFPGPWSEGQRMSGLTIRDLNAGSYLPHGFHLYPALIALFFTVGGISTALLTTPFLALLGSLAIYLTVARVWGESVGLLTLLLLTFSVTQIWFMGYPTAEIMVQVLFWGGLFALILLIENNSNGKATAVLAGSCFGLMHLAKLDTVLIPVTVGILFFYFWIRQQFQPVYWWSILLYLLLTVQALLHASFIATIYFLDHAVRNLLPAFIADRLVVAADGYPYPADWIGRFITANWPLLLLAGFLIPVVLGLLHWLHPMLNRVWNKLAKQTRLWQHGIVVGVLIVTLGITVANQFLTSTALDGTMQATQLSRLYLTRVGMLGAFLGLLLLIYQANSTPKLVALFLLIGNVVPLYILGAGTSPDHFWVIRRFIPIAFPAALLAMSAIVWFLWSYLQAKQAMIKWPMKIAAIGLLLAILAGFLQHIRFIARVVEFDGLTAQLESFANSLPEEAVLLMEKDTPAQQFSLPLWFLFDKSVFSIRSEVKEDVYLETAVANWQNSGRPVYWVATKETPPPLWPNWQQQHQFTYLIDVPQMETPLDRIPHKLERLQLQLDIYRLIK